MKRNRAVIMAVILIVVVGAALAAWLVPGGRPGFVTRGPEIGIIYIDGVLTAGPSLSSLTGTTQGSDEIISYLRDAREDPAVRAVVLRINSPGGSAAAAQEISTEIKKLRDAGKPVVASMADVGASGAYWIAANADAIVANPATLTGSIGVIVEVQNLAGLYDKLGIKYEVVKSGPLKDMGADFRSMTGEERQVFTTMVNDLFQQFVTVVADGRHLDRDKVLSLADGRAYTGDQARALGLVDELGNYYDAIDKAAELAQITSYTTKEYGVPTLWDELRSLLPGGWFAGVPPRVQLIDPSATLPELMLIMPPGGGR